MSLEVLRLSLKGQAGALETILEDPGVPGTSYAVICHPHPLFGGTMENKVVTTVARALRESGIPTLRFNFRGVGASGGAFDQGAGETADADAVASWGAEHWPGRTLVAAGFSFGGYVALRLAQLRESQQREPRLLITIAPAVQRFDAHSTAPPRCPWLVVQGDADDVVDPAAVIDWVNSLDPKPQLLVMPGVGHFFHGRLQELRDAVMATVRGG
jgi:alpha/beta superfamily hydrolase